MKIIHTTPDAHTLNIEPREDLMQELLAYAEREGLQAAHITGLGAAAEVELAYYNLKNKAYEHTVITEDVEICSLVGNISVGEGGQTIVHLHGVFARQDLSTFGGHVVRCIISGAGELHLSTPPGRINRTYDAQTGLTLMCPHQ